MASLIPQAERAKWERPIQVVTHRVGRRFGFQSYNYDATGKVWVPASITIASDHLISLLVEDRLPRDAPTGSTLEERFTRAVTTLHDTIFLPYKKWCTHVHLSPLANDAAREMEAIRKEPTGLPPPARNDRNLLDALLAELSLYFLIWTEAANVRHTPEGMWFLFWVMRNSPDVMVIGNSLPPTDTERLSRVLDHPHLYNGWPAFQHESRNKLASAIKRLRGMLSVETATVAGSYIAPWNWGRPSPQQQPGKALIISALDLLEAAASEGPSADCQAFLEEYSTENPMYSPNGLDPSVTHLLLATTIMCGDGGLFMDRVITPLFHYMSVQLDKHGGGGKDISQRLGYDDFNESFCNAEVVHRALRAMGVQVVKGRDVKLHPMGGVTPSSPWEGMLAMGSQSAAAENMKVFSVERAAGLWANHVFAKTFVEYRSVLMLFRSFYRVYLFHFCYFHFLSAIAWDSRWKVISSVVLTHAGCQLLYQLSSLWTQRPVPLNLQTGPRKVPKHRGKPRKDIEAVPSIPLHELDASLHGYRSLWWKNLAGFLIWAAIFLILAGAYVLFLTDRSRVAWNILPIVYMVVLLIWSVLSTRPGYMVSLSTTVDDWARSRSVIGWTTKPFLKLVSGLITPFTGITSVRDHAQYWLFKDANLAVPFSTFMLNNLFWVFVMMIKVPFDYLLVLKPLNRNLELLWERGWLDVDNCRGDDFDADIILVIALVVPAFLVVLIGTSVFYSLTAASFGAVRGLVRFKISDVNSWSSVTASFSDATHRYWVACMSEYGKDHWKDDAARATKFMRRSAQDALRKRASTTDLASASDDEGGFPTVASMPTMPSSTKFRLNAPPGAQNVLQMFFQDSRESIVFADAWEKVVLELREYDLVSDAELSHLQYTHIDFDDTMKDKVVAGVKPFMLPTFLTAGQVEQALVAPEAGDSVTHELALSETRSWLVWALLQLGIVDNKQHDDVTALLSFTPVSDIESREHMISRAQGLAAAKGLINGLCDLEDTTLEDNKAAVAKREKAVRAVQAQLLKVFQSLENELKVRRKTLGMFKKKLTASGRKMKRACKALTAFLERAQSSHSWAKYKYPARLESAYPRTRLLSKSPVAAEEVLLRESVIKVLHQVRRSMSTVQKDSEPRGAEAQRVLGFFLASLRNSTIHEAPSVQSMLSMNTLVPHYEEDVMYAFSKEQVATDLDLKLAVPGPWPQDLTSIKDDGASSFAYLRSIYPMDWENFTERMGKAVGVKPNEVTEQAFQPGGPLEALQMELLLWATYRGQLLGRTVKGMMCYASALRHIALTEIPIGSLSSQDYTAAVDRLVASKFTLVVASQVYGANRGSKVPNKRWLAFGVEELMRRQRGMQVAFMDKDIHGVQFSVLCEARDAGPDSTTRPICEVYRVRLPANTGSGRGVVIGEGKPENQNHATIFAHNECLQTVDMNQDGNFAEALKMRNLLAEFSSDKTVQSSYALEAEERKRLEKQEEEESAILTEAESHHSPLYEHGDGSSDSITQAHELALPVHEEAPEGLLDPPQHARVDALRHNGASPYESGSPPLSQSGRYAQDPYGTVEERGDQPETMPSTLTQASFDAFPEAGGTPPHHQLDPMPSTLTQASFDAFPPGDADPAAGLYGEESSQEPSSYGRASRPAERGMFRRGRGPVGEGCCRDKTALDVSKPKPPKRIKEPGVGLDRVTVEPDKKPVALVGFREWIFSDTSGALAGFAAATEFTFGTIVQRVMMWPGNVRFHYGHPDVWNKLFTMTRGGVSKPTRAFHVSEDVFGGYNHMLRGGRIKYKEYISVGKGRDMGFDSINLFEGKVAGGNGEQILSRDVYRLGARFDFCRLMSMYHTGCGFYVNTWLTMLSVYVHVWVITLLSISTSNLLGCFDNNRRRKLLQDESVQEALTLDQVEAISPLEAITAVNFQQIFQMGMISIVTYAIELILEIGLLPTLATILQQLIQGSFLFYIFRSQTTSHYFSSDIKYGGAKYMGTGRGYALSHIPFVSTYTRYARSHMYLAVRLISLLLLLLLVGIPNPERNSYIRSTWGAWLVSIALLISPIWFNPSSFDIKTVHADFSAWSNWIRGGQDAGTKTTWHSWNKEQLEASRNDKNNQKDRFWSISLPGILGILPGLVLTLASVDLVRASEVNKKIIRESYLERSWSRYAVAGVVSGILLAFLLTVYVVRRVLQQNRMHATWQVVRVVVLYVGSVVLLTLLGKTVGTRNMTLILFANLEAAATVITVLTYLGAENFFARHIVDQAYLVLDTLMGYVLFAGLYVLSFLVLPNIIQTTLLFNVDYQKRLQSYKTLQDAASLGGPRMKPSKKKASAKAQ